jgi:methylated-DNA-[protein]-cysteine S-methyltransferase
VTTKIRTATVKSPVGDLVLTVERETLCGLVFSDFADDLFADLERRYGALTVARERDPAGTARRLHDYLDGDLHALDALPAETGGTPFQRQVWAALRRVPVGQTRSYADLARAVGAPKAVRAVGAANGKNPVCLVIPCHRIIASDGTLCGYGGGLPRKRWLLVHEGALLV